MGNFSKSFIVREAENILDKLNIENKTKKDKMKIMDLKKKCKKLKRMNIFWKICTSVSIIMFIIAII